MTVTSLTWDPQRTATSKTESATYSATHIAARYVSTAPYSASMGINPLAVRLASPRTD